MASFPTKPPLTLSECSIWDKYAEGWHLKVSGGDANIYKNSINGRIHPDTPNNLVAYDKGTGVWLDDNTDDNSIIFFSKNNVVYFDGQTGVKSDGVVATSKSSSASVMEITRSHFQRRRGGLFRRHL